MLHFWNANEVLMVKDKAVIFYIYYDQKIQIRNKTKPTKPKKTPDLSYFSML